MVWELFSERGIFEFGDASPAIRRLAGSRAPFGSSGHSELEERLHLNSAEIMLPPLTPELWRSRPITVASRAADLAMLATNCTPFQGCLSDEPPALWDVTLFGSDANKLARVAGTTDVVELRKQFVAVIRRLRDLYLEHAREPNFQEVAQPRVVALKGALWRAKLAALLHEDVPADEIDQLLALGRLES
jgi:hypothetical protein